MSIHCAYETSIPETIEQDHVIHLLCLQQQCMCGSSNCRGVIGGKPRLNGQQRDRPKSPRGIVTNVTKKSNRKSRAEKLVCIVS